MAEGNGIYIDTTATVTGSTIITDLEDPYPYYSLHGDRGTIASDSWLDLSGNAGTMDNTGSVTGNITNSGTGKVENTGDIENSDEGTNDGR